MQRLLNSARWDPRQVRTDLRDYVMGNLGHRTSTPHARWSRVRS
jgi:hypothetical protein